MINGRDSYFYDGVLKNSTENSTSTVIDGNLFCSNVNSLHDIHKIITKMKWRIFC